MGKLWRRNARWRKAGRLLLDVEFAGPIHSQRAKRHWQRDGIRQWNADVSGRQRTLSIRSFMVIRIVLMRARRIRLMVRMTLVNQPRILKQIVR